MYIKQWWGEYIGSSDDSLLLLDYFGTKPTTQFTLKEIMEELHLDELLIADTYKEGDLFFELKEGFVPHFQMSTSVLIDLSAMVVESLKSGYVVLKDLDSHSKYDKHVRIEACMEDIQRLKRGLDYFITHSNTSEMAEFLSEEELDVLVEDCRAISHELGEK